MYEPVVRVDQNTTTENGFSWVDRVRAQRRRQEMVGVFLSPRDFMWTIHSVRQTMLMFVPDPAVIGTLQTASFCLTPQPRFASSKIAGSARLTPKSSWPRKYWTQRQLGLCGFGRSASSKRNHTQADEGCGNQKKSRTSKRRVAVTRRHHTQAKEVWGNRKVTHKQKESCGNKRVASPPDNGIEPLTTRCITGVRVVRSTD